MYQTLGKTERILKYRSEIKKIPKQYKENYLKEELAIRYASEQYNKQYTNLFPTNPELLLSPMNEFGQRKFISTFIVPSLLPYDEIFDYEGCASFISDHITFEPILRDVKKIPDIIASPTMTLATQKGDCFDITLLLVSLLVGAGYNAFCVCGHAKKDLTLNDTTQREYDLRNIIGNEESTKEEVIEKNERRYQTKEKVRLVSKYMTQLEEKKRQQQEERKQKKKEKESSIASTKQRKKKEEEETEGEGEENDKEETKEAEQEEDDDERIFCWVVLLPPSRGIEEPMYINPSNGEITPVSDENYVQALTVWNHDNYWVNMQESHVDYDLQKENWECIFLGDEGEFDKEIEEDEKEVLDLPLSFCQPLFISKQRFQTRFPSSTKVIEYKNLKLRRSAPFFEKDLSVAEVFVYNMQAIFKRRSVIERHVIYQKRKDKLQKRSEFFDKFGEMKKSTEKYGKGRKYSSTRMEGLKEIVTVHGKMEEYHFYPSARLDGLSMIRKIRFEKDPSFTRKVVFKFCDRDDFLCYRSVSYDPSGARVETKDTKLKIEKKSERFERNLEKKADEDVSKLEFYPNRMKVIYHFGGERITCSSKEFTRDGEVSVNLVNHFAVKPTREDTMKEFNMLFKLDKRCSDEITRVMEELKEITEKRISEEQNIKNETSIYDYLQNKSEMDDDDDDDEEKSKKKKRIRDSSSSLSSSRSRKKKKNDVLGLYIPDSGIKDKEQAIQIFDEIMDRTKNRLSIRAQIIQDRLKTEKSLMNKKRLQIQKQDTENTKKEEQFLKFWEETIFKTKILQERCDKNIKESEEQYLKTQMSLLNDERLKVFFKDEVDIQLKDLKDVM